MLVIGARGHAIEVLQVLEDAGYSNNLYFFDNINDDTPAMLFDRFPVLRSISDAKDQLMHDSRVVIGIGGPHLRERVAQQMGDIGGRLFTIVSTSAKISLHDVYLADGLNIMDGVLISNGVCVGEGTLLNARATLHHNCQVGRYCEVSPGAQLLGHVSIEDYSQIGAGAIILPRIRVGRHAIVGAGAVVTRDVADNSVVAGVPARLLKKAKLN